MENPAETAMALGHEIHFHDLYAEKFDPVLTLEELRRKMSLDDLVLAHSLQLEESRGIILVYPDWWGQPPALLKGWLDRVLRPGFAYNFKGEEFMKKHRVPLLTGKKALIICTADSEQVSDGMPIESIWKNQVLGYCGMQEVEFISMYEVHESNFAQRQHWLSSAAELVEKQFPRRGS